MTEQPMTREAMRHTPDECHRYNPELHAAAQTLRCVTFSEASAKARLWNTAPALLAACEELLAVAYSADAHGHTNTQQSRCLLCDSLRYSEHRVDCPTRPIRAAVATAKGIRNE